MHYYKNITTNSNQKVLAFMIMLCVFTTIFSFDINAQIFKRLKEKKERKVLFAKADKLLEDGNFDEATMIFEKLYYKEPQNSLLNYKLGLCYLFSPLNIKKSINHLRSAIIFKYEKHKKKNAPIEAYYYLGRAYHLNYMFNDAIRTYESLLKVIPDKDNKFQEVVSREIEICRDAENLIKDTVNVELLRLDSINSEYTEHSPVVSADEKIMIFTSKRKGTTGNRKLPNGEYFEDLYISYKNDSVWSTPQNLKAINSDKHESTCSLSPDGRILYVYREGDIYTTKMQEKEWLPLQKLGRTINTQAKESHASISANGRYLYFSSSRFGGYGGLDIYRSELQSDGKWGKAENLGPAINTKYDEEGPFIHPDGVTLYFSSKGHRTLGGYDIFYSLYENGNWQTPVNMKFPINTTDDDVFFRPSANGKAAYFVSERKSGKGKADIYKLLMPDEKEKPVKLITGTVLSGDSVLDDPKITVTEIEAPDIPNKTLPRNTDGKYVIAVNAQKDINLTVEAQKHLVFTENFAKTDSAYFIMVEKPIELTKIEKGRTLKAYNILFEDKSAKITPYAKVKLEKIANNIMENEVLLVDVSANKDFGAILSQQRIDAVIDFFFKFGIEKERILTYSNIAKMEKNAIVLTIIDQDSKPTYVENSNKLKKEKEAERVKEIMSIRNIFFDLNKYTTNKYYKELNTLALFLLSNPGAVVEITGYTDQIGSKGYNVQLSIKRTNFVKDYLLNKGVRSEQINALGCGEQKPLAEITTKDGTINMDAARYNRRVEINLERQGSKSELVVEEIEVPDEYKVDKQKEEPLIYSILLEISRKPLAISKFPDGVKLHKSTDYFYYYFIGDYSNVEEAEAEIERLKAIYPAASIFVNDF